jgi:hypothetical protein
MGKKHAHDVGALALRLRLSPQSRREKARVQQPLTWADEFRLRQGGRV